MLQMDLAKRLGIPASTICRLEQGKGRPSLQVALKLEKKLGIPVEAWT